MDSTNSESAANSRYTNTVSYDDELDRCEQISEIKARIVELEKHQASTRERKERFLQGREERLRASRDVSLSMYKFTYVDLIMQVRYSAHQNHDA